MNPMRQVFNEFGDDILQSIRENSTPLTNSLLKITLALVISMAVLWGVEKIFEIIQKKGGHREADLYAMRFVCVMIQYVILITALYFVLRSVITAISERETSSLQDVILWLHQDTVTLYDYAIKLLVALVIFVIFHAAQTGLFRLIKRYLDRLDVREEFVNLILNLVKYILLSFIVILSMLQLMITGGNNLLALITYTYICVTIALPFKMIKQRFPNSSQTVEWVLTIAGRVFGMILLVAAMYGLYAGLKYFLWSGGNEMSAFLNLPESSIETELNTTFTLEPNLTSALSQKSGSHIIVRSDGELNIIYMEGDRVGVNTSGRKYQFFGVSVNQPEISAVHNMTYKYNGTGEEVTKMPGSSRAHYYYNTQNNDCLVLTVNTHSNRVVSVTYYNDYQRIIRDKILTED